MRNSGLKAGIGLAALVFGIVFAVSRPGMATSPNDGPIAVDGLGNVYTAYGVPVGFGSAAIGKWNGVNWENLGSGISGAQVNAILCVGTDVYVGGAFTAAGGIVVNNIAKWDGYNWSSLGGGVDGAVNDIELSGNDLIVGGDFAKAGSITVNSIARWDGSSWSPIGDGLQNYRAWRLAESNSRIAAAEYYDYVYSYRSSVEEWDGSTWTLVNNRQDSVGSIAFKDGDLYASGNLGGVSRVAMWNGTAWQSVGNSFSGALPTRMVSNGSDLYVGGGFVIGNFPNQIHNLARLNGSTWEAVANKDTPNVSAMAIGGQNVYVGSSTQTSVGSYKWDGSNWIPFGTGAPNWISGSIGSGQFPITISPGKNQFVTVYGSGSSVKFSRTNDGGQTWSQQTTINDDTATTTLHHHARIATDKAGSWVAVYMNDISHGEIDAVRSTDDGMHWAPHSVIGSGSWPDLATDANGNWVVAFTTAGTKAVTIVHSGDNGATWSAPVSVATSDGSGPALSTDQNGNWLVVWSLSGKLNCSRSSDAGVTWLPPIEIGPGYGREGTGAALASDHKGRWMVASTIDSIFGNPYEFDAGDLSCYISNDNGNSWNSLPYPFNTPAYYAAYPPDGAFSAGTYIENSPQISTNGLGEWAVSYSIFASQIYGNGGGGYERSYYGFAGIARFDDRIGGWQLSSTQSAGGDGYDSPIPFGTSIANDGLDKWLVTWNTADTEDIQFKTDKLHQTAVSGQVTDNGSPVANVALIGLPGTPHTNEAGKFFEFLPEGWTGVVQPNLAGHAFSPSSINVPPVSADVTLNFEVVPGPPRYTLTLGVNPPGSGSVVADPLPDFDNKYAEGTVVTLTANPYAGNTFDSWTGDIGGSNSPAQIIMNFGKSVTAAFNAPPPRPDLSLAWRRVSQTCNRNGCTLFINCTVTNHGPVDTPSSNLCFWTSSEDEVNSQSTELKCIPTGTVRAGRTAQKRASIKLPASVSGLFVVGMVDTDDTVAESDEINNTMSFGPLP